jgi:hypothetical protein
MRNTTSWRKDLEKELSRHLVYPSALSPREVCSVELGLYLLESLAPNQPASALWTLLTGHPFLAPKKEDLRHKIFNGRHLINRYKSRHLWDEALGRYAGIKESLRGYDVDAKKEKFRRRAVAFARERFAIYEKALASELPFLHRDIKWAESASYRMSDGHGGDYGVEIPEGALFTTPGARHILKQEHKSSAITVRWSELIKTARWMDKTETEREVQRHNWEHRLIRSARGGGNNGASSVQLETFDSKGRLALTDELQISGVTHFVGMVSSGKSTLMDVVAVWGAKKGLHVTLVVGDVIGALNRAQLFQNLGINAVPVLGSTRRAAHINSLHKALFARQSEPSIAHAHVGFRWLSTACPLDGLRRDENPEPFDVDFRPCTELRPVQIVSGNGSGPKYCPLYNACPYHQAQRDLVEAAIWIATPASLVHTRVAEQINQESIRFAELVTRRSHLVIVDEADRVQMQLDEIFSPNQVLCSAGGEGWLDNLEQKVGEQIGKNGRASVAGEQVEIWRRAHHQAQIAADAVYRRLLGNRELREWIHELYFFTDILIFDRLAQAMSDDSGKQTAHYKNLRKEFDQFIDRGLSGLFYERLNDEGELLATNKPLANFANRLLMSSDSHVLRRDMCAWVEKRSKGRLGKDLSEQMAERLEFALLIAILSDRLNVLIGRWKEVEELLGLEHSPSTLLYRPPLDYQSLLPATPVGNVLAFQYLHDEHSGAATLKFLRCTGVGRWLLLHLHDMLADEGVLGPHVLLLSGTSWAGGDPSYHVQVPVSGILRAPKEETDAIALSEFHFLPLRDEHDQAIKISGLFGERREEALRQMLRNLARPDNLSEDNASILERERDTLPDGRRRILLVVGSYKEAEVVREYLERERPDWRDRNEFVQLERDASSNTSDLDFTVKLPRGQVDQFAATSAWLLIAPLMSIERGHNILNKKNVAAIGAAYFLVRPHPRPQDLSYAVRSLNKWAVEVSSDLSRRLAEQPNLDQVGQSWRREANYRWRDLLRTDFIYSNLPQHERDLLTWNLMVSIWQIIGRLVRGGQPARVYFCDAKFDPVRAGLAAKSISLLDEMRRVLAPYFDNRVRKGTSTRDRVLVQNLYGPLFQALESMRY